MLCEEGRERKYPVGSGNPRYDAGAGRVKVACTVVALFSLLQWSLAHPVCSSSVTCPRPDLSKGLDSDFSLKDESTFRTGKECLSLLFLRQVSSRHHEGQV